MPHRPARPRRLIALCAAAAALTALVVPSITPAALPVPLPTVDPTVAPIRDTEPVIMTGALFADWSAPSNTTVKLPLTDLKDCQSFNEQCKHNNYADPEVDSQKYAPQQGTPINRLIGYRWDEKAKRFVQIPFQVDEMFTRYLDNSASGFSVYSGQDQHTSYAFDREGFRYRNNAPDNVCLARPDGDLAVDPVRGLDNNDEVVFMASDSGAKAPAGATLPGGIQDVREVRVTDPNNGGSATYAYVMRATEKNGARPAYDASNGYVSYRRDANADIFAYSQSKYDSYGNAARGPYCDDEGHIITKDKKGLLPRRRPRDFASISTERYSFRYDGRWLLTQLRISPDAGKSYGPDLIDRFKARAFAQDPGSKTPCCGFEEEDTNWGGSSSLLGELAGPVRAVRETWGADSGTNVIRRETFYRDEIRQKTYLRVHVIPPLDGIYAQWDYNAGRMTRFFNARTPAGVAVDGKNDEIFGNLDDPCNENYHLNDTSQLDQGYRSLYGSTPACMLPSQVPDKNRYHQSIDVSDPTFADANASLNWTQISGPFGSIVDRYSVEKATDLTPGGAPQSVVAVPYYRDDACFDDGTGNDPGIKLNPSEANEPRTYGNPAQPRKCWKPTDGPTKGTDEFFQGSIGTHGVHLLFLVDSDNARQQFPVDEIVTEYRQVLLPGEKPNVGESYGRNFEKPLVALAFPFTGTQPPPETPPDRPHPAPMQGAPPSRLGVTDYTPATSVPYTGPGSGVKPRGCRDRSAPRSDFTRKGLKMSRRGFTFSGHSRDRGCRVKDRTPGRVSRVDVAVGRVVARGCRFLDAKGKFGPRRSCRRPRYLRARTRYLSKEHRNSWALARRVSLPRGTYDLTVRAIDPRGIRETKRRTASFVQTRVR